MASVDINHDIPYRTDSARHHAHRGGFTLADAFVVTAIGVVAMAVAIGLVARIGFEPPIAVAVAAMSFFAMLAGHIALRRAEAPPRHRVVRRRGGDKPADARAQMAANAAPLGAAAKSVPDVETSDGKTSLAAKPTTAVDGSVVPPIGKTAAPDSSATGSPASLPDTKTSDRDADAIKQLDLGNFRPRSAADLTSPSAKKAAPDADNGGNIDDMIRRLANDIEAGRKPTPSKPAALARDSSAVPPTSPEPQALNVAAQMPPPLPGHAAAAKAAEPSLPFGSDRPHAPFGAQFAANPPAAGQPAPKPSATAKLAAIADALTDEQMDVFLETINGLEDYRAQHYEVSVRLNLADGSRLGNDDFISETRGTGLLPLLEAVKVSNTKRLAVQMIRRGRTGEFFSGVDGEALSDEQFGEDVNTITGGDKALASRLVLTFSQADVRTLTPAQRQTLDTIAALGFRFSIEDVTDLDMDFEALAARGFAFAKLDADVFLKGLPTGTARVPAADICNHLAKAGLALIVGKIGDEMARAKILGFGAVLGQGALFGVPRPVRADVLRPVTEQRTPVI